MYQELKIIRGLKKVPNDVFAASSNLGLSTQDLNAETGLISIDLMNASSGFSVETTPYDFPQPALEGGGIWTDSVLSVGRKLIFGNDSNVDETFNVTISGNGSRQLLYERMTTLNWMRDQVIAFHSQFTQYDPVYLKVQMLDEPGPRYALIYRMDIVYDQPDVTGIDAIDCTISIEREPFFTPIAPGENPKLWAMDRRGESVTQPYDLDLVSNAASSYLYERVNNRYESQDPVNGVTPGEDAYYSKNYVTIPAEDLPGDAPVLTQLTVIPEFSEQLVSTITYYLTGLLVGVSSLPTKVFSRDKVYNDAAANDQPLEYSNIFILNGANDGVLGSTTNDTGGVIGSGVAGTTKQAGVVATVGTRSDFLYGTWDSQNSDLSRAIDQNALMNRYAFYLRCRKTGSTTNISVRIRMRLSTSTANNPYYISNDVTVPDPITDQVSGANTNYWNMLYLGSGSINPRDNATSGADGRGWNNSGIQLAIDLYVTHDNGTDDLRVCDLIMVPIADAAIEFKAVRSSKFDTESIANAFYDNTGYSLHGRRQALASNLEKTAYAGNDIYTDQIIEANGSELVLRPKLTNRMHFFAYFLEPNNGGTNLYSKADFYMDVGLNILPRWRAIRDV